MVCETQYQLFVLSRVVCSQLLIAQSTVAGIRSLSVFKRPFATNDHMVQNPPYWRASSLLFPHWDVKTKRLQPVKRDWPLFLSPTAGIIMSLPFSMADFVPCDRLLQKAYCNPFCFGSPKLKIKLFRNKFLILVPLKIANSLIILKD